MQEIADAEEPLGDHRPSDQVSGNAGPRREIGREQQAVHVEPGAEEAGDERNERYGR